MDVASLRHLQQRSHGLCTWKTTKKLLFYPQPARHGYSEHFGSFLATCPKTEADTPSFHVCRFQGMPEPQTHDVHSYVYRDATCYSVIPSRKRLYRLPYLHPAAKGFAGSSAARTAIAPSEFHGNTHNSVQLNSCQKVS